MHQQEVDKGHEAESGISEDVEAIEVYVKASVTQVERLAERYSSGIFQQWSPYEDAVERLVDT